MTRLDAATARAVDRLARGAHAFHRFAHHPLCDRYRGELVALGRRTRVCRGCALCALGLLAGAHSAGLAAASGLSPAATAPALAGLGALGLAAGGASLRWRIPKPFGRFAASFAFAAALGSCALGGLELRLLGALLCAGACAGVLAYRRRGPDRRPCARCPEHALGAGCSGFRPIWRRERAFQRAADRLIYGRSIANRLCAPPAEIQRTLPSAIAAGQGYSPPVPSPSAPAGSEPQAHDPAS